MGDALIVPAIGGSILIDKVGDVHEAHALNCDKRFTIKIHWSNLTEYQELALCQLLQKMSEDAKVNHTYAHTVGITKGDNETEPWLFNLPRQCIQTQDKNGYKITIHPDKEDGFYIKARRAFWKDVAIADKKLKDSTSETNMKDFLDKILDSLGASATSKKISWWGRLWKNSRRVFFGIVTFALIVVATWAFVTFGWPVILAGVGIHLITTAGITTMVWAAPSIGAILAGLGTAIAGISAASLAIGALVTSCTVPK